MHKVRKAPRVCSWEGLRIFPNRLGDEESAWSGAGGRTNGMPRVQGWLLWAAWGSGQEMGITSSLNQSV